MPTGSKHTFTITFFFSILFISTMSVYADGGLEKVDTFIESVLSILRGISVGVVTIAIMWAGYKFLFRQADLAECGKILGGGLLIGGASELAQYLLG